MNINTNSIFITKSELDSTSDISGKITYTSVMEIIPHDSTSNPLVNWEEKGKIEWRWRFLKFNNKTMVEISYKKPFEDRLYFNKNGQWVERDIPDIYDQCVVKSFYYYTDYLS